MDWRCSSGVRAITLQPRSPEFEPQSHRKKKEEKEMKFFLPIAVFWEAQGFELLGRTH
jgi:hypothetical protein